ncbi:MAG: hypothetical protein I3274_08165 [Candidatus Moeniiplasma glomeromycotorum]|nr:hypothetical protein [Candidatus Moeniiplasma glomeromycotorum]
MVSLEQKEKNKQYVLSHFEEYTFDSHGNFVNVAPDTEGDEWFFCFNKDSFTPEAYEELKTKLFETVLREIKDWEIVFGKRFDGSINKGKIEYFRHKPSKKRINFLAFDHERNYRLVGELGYRRNVWENYEEIIKLWDERKKQFQENITNNDNQQSQPQNQQGETEPKPSAPNPKKENGETNNPTNQNQNSPISPSDKENVPPEKGKDNPKDNSSLPSQPNNKNQENFDKNKPEKENNSNPSPNEKEQDQEFLKVINEAELLIKKKKFNSKILTKLIAEKKQNSSLYQSLNKDGKIDKLIRELENIQQAQKNSNKSVREKKNRPSPPTSLSTKIFLGIGISCIIIFGLIIIFQRAIKRKNKKR